MRRYSEIERAEGALNAAQDAYLRQRGWARDCNRPGSLWLWEKDINGKVYVCDKKTAISLSRYMELMKL